MKLGETCIHGSLKRQCETCEIADERDRLKHELFECDKYAKEQYEAYDEEIYRLKAELGTKTKWLDETLARGDKMIQDRDAWKQKTERLAEALRDVLNH